MDTPRWHFVKVHQMGAQSARLLVGFAAVRVPALFVFEHRVERISDPGPVRLAQVLEIACFLVGALVAHVELETRRDRGRAALLLFIVFEAELEVLFADVQQHAVALDEAVAASAAAVAVVDDDAGSWFESRKN